MSLRHIKSQNWNLRVDDGAIAPTRTVTLTGKRIVLKTIVGLVARWGFESLTVRLLFLYERKCEKMKDEELYVVEYGQIWSYKSDKFLNPTFNDDGYYMVSLYKDKNEKKLSIHKLK